MELDDIQKKILIGCLENEQCVSISALPLRGKTFLIVNIDVPENMKEEYLDIQNHWVTDLIGTYLVKTGKSVYRLTEEGLKIARKLRDEAQPANA